MGAAVVPWLTSLTDLRILLNDNSFDKRAFEKSLFGSVDGTNTVFKTFETRIVPGSITIFVNKLPQTITAFDYVAGEFTLSTAPPPASAMKASYYFQYFLDNELTDFVSYGAERISISDVTLVPFGLQQAVLEFAASFAYEKLSSRWMNKMSETFLMQDAPMGNEATRSNLFKQQADTHYKNAIELRDDFYKRQGRRNAPAYGRVKGNVPYYTPRR